VDSDRFDALVRSFSHLPSRRDILRGVIGAVAGLGSLHLQTAGARHKHHNKHKDPQSQDPPSPPSQPSPRTPSCTPRCIRKQCGDDGCGGSCGTCSAGQFCRTGTCCTPRAKDIICTADCPTGDCPGRCDTVTNIRTCGQPVTCSCPTGQECLSNGGCGQVCRDFHDCPGETSHCFNCDASTEGRKHCSVGQSCTESLCSSTADCPVGSQCQVTACGPNGNDKRCVRLSVCTR